MGGLLAFIGSTLVKELLATIGLLAFVGGTLVKKLLAMIGLLVFVGGTLVKEALVMSCLLLFASSLLISMALAGRCPLEAVVLVLPQGIDHALPILEDTFCKGASPKKNWPPGQFWRLQAGSLLVLPKCSLKPILVVKGTTNIGWQIEFLKNIKHPVRGAWGRLQPLVLQPPRRIGEGGQGQMSRQ